MYFKKKFGNLGEDIATSYLESLKYEIIERNFRCRSGEIDIIAKNNIKNVNVYLGILLICLFVSVSIKPVLSAIVSPNKEISNVPNGAKLKKFLVALLIKNFIPSKDNKFSTATKFDSLARV